MWQERKQNICYTLKKTQTPRTQKPTKSRQTDPLFTHESYTVQVHGRKAQAERTCIVILERCIYKSQTRKKTEKTAGGGAGEAAINGLSRRHFHPELRCSPPAPRVPGAAAGRSGDGLSGAGRDPETAPQALDVETKPGGRGNRETNNKQTNERAKTPLQFWFLHLP